MIGDIWTIIRKEGKEILLVRGSLRGGTSGLLIFVLIFGAFLPWQFGPEWVESPLALVYWAWVPLLLVNNVIADSFAGERERHTLETLLASRLSDRVILFGKIGAGIGYGWGLTLASLLLGLVTLNLTYDRGEPILYPPTIGFGVVSLSLLVAWLAAGVGVLISLRASTVRQAQQSMGIAIVLLMLVPLLAGQTLPPEWKKDLFQMLIAADVTRIVLGAVVTLLVVDVGLLLAGMARFRRARLILD